MARPPVIRPESGERPGPCPAMLGRASRPDTDQGNAMPTTKWMLKTRERMERGLVRQGPLTFQLRVIGEAGCTPVPEVGDMVPGDFTGSGGIGFIVVEAAPLEEGLAPGQEGWSGSVAPLLVIPR
jgi:hypothetical protein